MTWLWKVPDLRTRLEFARANAPSDTFTQAACLIVYHTVRFLALVLFPIDYAARSLGKTFDKLGRFFGLFYVGSLLLYLLLSILWLPFWGMLVGSSWVWLNYAWARPILLLPGAVLSMAMTVFLMFVPDPQKQSGYVSFTREWPLTWTLWNPPQSYFQEYNILDPDVNPYEAERLISDEAGSEPDAAPRKYDPKR